MSELRFSIRGSDAANAATARTEAVESGTAARATTMPASIPPRSNFKGIDPREGCSLVVSVPTTIVRPLGPGRAYNKAQEIVMTALHFRAERQVEICVEAGGEVASIVDHHAVELLLSMVERS